MKTCQPCPDIYPWTGKTGIRSSRIDNEVENWGGPAGFNDPIDHRQESNKKNPPAILIKDDPYDPD